MPLCGRLFSRLGLRRRGLCLAMAVVCFHPAFIWMAGGVNNDILCVMLGLYALAATAEWAAAPSVRTIVPVALGVGLSMMAKLSGGLLAPGIAVVFLWRAGQDVRRSRRELGRYIRQFALFAAICVPLALWWQVKNAVLYGTPLTYVPGMSDQSSQYIGQYSVWQRLFGLPAESFRSPFILWEREGAPFNEYSIPLATLKTAVFDETALFSSGTAVGEGSGADSGAALGAAVETTAAACRADSISRMDLAPSRAQSSPIHTGTRTNSHRGISSNLNCFNKYRALPAKAPSTTPPKSQNMGRLHRDDDFSSGSGASFCSGVAAGTGAGVAVGSSVGEGEGEAVGTGLCRGA